MSQQIKLSSLLYADTRAVKSFTEQYHVIRTVWKGCKAILNNLKGRDQNFVSVDARVIKEELKRNLDVRLLALRATDECLETRENSRLFRYQDQLGRVNSLSFFLFFSSNFNGGKAASTKTQGLNYG